MICDKNKSFAVFNLQKLSYSVLSNLERNTSFVGPITLSLPLVL